MNTVINKIVRLSERDNLLNFLDQLEKIIYNQNIDVKTFIEKNAPFHISGEIIGFLGYVVDVRDTDLFSVRIKELKNDLKALPVIRLTISFEPGNAFVDYLAHLFRNEFGNPVIFDFIKDESILAGAIIEGESRIGKYLLSEYFETRKEIDGF